MENQQPKPNDYLVWSILTTLFCCLPIGIAAIVYSAKVGSLYNAGDYQGACKASATAKTLVLVTAAVGLISHIIYFAVVGAAGIMATMHDNVIVP
ncbi:MAG: CD225/dispanin family protein [Bacteroidales bacterium]|nr:CD225/dispanin family protein [Bacteroidales bacterium]